MLSRPRIPEKDALKKLLDDLQSVDNRHEAFQTFRRIAESIGFSGVMFVSRNTGAGWVEDIAETSYPDNWVKHYIQSGYTRTDPTRRYLIRNPTPVFWSEISSFLRKKECLIFDGAKCFGILSGISVPLYEAGALVGGVGFSADTKIPEDPRLKSTVIIAAQIFSTVYNQIVAEERGGGLESTEISPALSKREREVLFLLSTGMGNQDIADALHISHSATVHHLKNLFEKLGVGNRVSAVVKGIKLGLVSPE